mgnify:CR=1 FL=1|eukprot:31510-Pelagococcus_subviridis.AAC.5
METRIRRGTWRGGEAEDGGRRASDPRRVDGWWMARREKKKRAQTLATDAARGRGVDAGTHVTDALGPDVLVELDVDAHVGRLHDLLRELLHLRSSRERSDGVSGGLGVGGTMREIKGERRGRTSARGGRPRRDATARSAPWGRARRPRRDARVAGVASVARDASRGMPRARNRPSRALAGRKKAGGRTADTARGARFLNVTPWTALARLMVYSRVTTS